MSEVIGKPIDRVDGKLKVTGGAIYSAEFFPENLLYGVTVPATISRGRIVDVNTEHVKRLPGIIEVITYKNSLLLHQPESGIDTGSVKLGEKDMLPLQSDRVHYDGQHIAIVVAETFEQAEHGASQLAVEYERHDPKVDIEDVADQAYVPKSFLGRKIQFERGEPVESKMSPYAVKEKYETPVYHHNPMEPHATVAAWNGDEVTVYDSTQSVLGSRNGVAQLLGIPAEKVHLISLFVGGGFGCKGFFWPHTVLAPMAAKIVGRPVKIVLTRQQMFTCNGRRGRTIQDIDLSADQDGQLASTTHHILTETSFVDEFVEPAGIVTPILYTSPNLKVEHKLVRLNKGTPCPTRAPGEAPGTFALESAMDELAYKLKMDPVALRLKNYAEKDPQDGKPWSAKYLRECYQLGAELIGWERRKPEPHSMGEGRYLVGYGMATAVYPANRSPAAAKVRIYADGHAEVECCSQDIGTGTYTIMAQIASESLGIPVDRIKVKLGDSQLPEGPNSGGSQTSASIGPPIRAAAIGARNKVLRLCDDHKTSALCRIPDGDVSAADGRIYITSNPSAGETYSEILHRSNKHMVEEEAKTNVSTREMHGKPKEKDETMSNTETRKDEAIDRSKYGLHSFGAQFAKVSVDPYLGEVRVTDFVGVMDVGKVLNMKLAKNQIMGGILFAIGMALMEGTEYDRNNGRVVTRDLAQYLVPVHADAPRFDIRFIDKPDPYISPIGSRGIGEIGITGSAAAVANAVYHATGKRIRKLPITPDKLI